MYITCTGCICICRAETELWATCGKIRYPLDLMRDSGANGEICYPLIVVCNIDGAKSANGKIRYALFCQAKSSQPIGPILEPVCTWVRSSHVGVLKGNPRTVTCVRYLFVWCGKCIAQQLPIMGTRLRSVSAIYTGQLRRCTQRKSQESCLHVVWVCEMHPPDDRG